MQLSELLPTLHQLPRADKFCAVQFLTTELAQDEGGLAPGAEYPVWSPYEAHEAAATLTQYLREQQNDWSKDGPELKSFLLEAVRGPHRPLRLEELDEMERRVLVEKSRRSN